MPILYKDWITREFVQENPDLYFVFGDNVERVGLGGQAKAMRGEPNAIGIPTKLKPSNEEDAFFRTKNFDEADEIFESYMKEEFLKLDNLLVQGKYVVIPTDGIGTGLSKLPEYAPELNTIIEQEFSALSYTYGNHTEHVYVCNFDGSLVETNPTETVIVDHENYHAPAMTYVHLKDRTKFHVTNLENWKRNFKRFIINDKLPTWETE